VDKYIVNTEKAPAAIGPYSQACGFANLLFLSGQIALSPDTGVLSDGSVSDQTERVMDNLKAVLGAANLGFENVVKTTIYLSNMNDFGLVNEVYGRFFPENPPARATVEVSRLPKNALVEIDLVAAFPVDAG
jgi:2-iminobutanoate/2-iminopropanoate deaminase